MTLTITPENLMTQTQTDQYIGSSTPFTNQTKKEMHTRWEMLRSPDTQTESLQEQIIRHRLEVADIVHQRSHKTAVIVGPCSVHSKVGTISYIDKMAELQSQLINTKLIIRLYGEKPRSLDITKDGVRSWRGLIANAHPEVPQDDQIIDPEGIKIMEELMLYAYSKNLAVATEFLNMETVSKLGHLPTVIAVGARTVTDSKFQDMANAMGELNISIGFKNDESGDSFVALSAIQNCTLNPNTFLILRGGTSGPNWREFPQHQIKKGVCIDANHSNSNKDLSKTTEILNEITGIDREERPRILMLESFIQSGARTPKEPILPDKSITDPCLGIDETIEHLHKLDK